MAIDTSCCRKTKVGTARCIRFNASVHSIRRMREERRQSERRCRASATFCTYTKSYVRYAASRSFLLLAHQMLKSNCWDVQQVQRHIYISLGRGIPSHRHFCILLASRLLVSAPEDARDGQSGEPTIDRTLTEQQSQRQDRDSLLGCHIRRRGSEKVGRVQMGRMETEVAPD